MRIIFKSFLITILAVLIAYIAGVRIYLDALFLPAPRSADFPSVQLELKGGQRMVGKVLKQTGDDILFLIEDDEIRFRGSDIRSMELLGEEGHRKSPSGINWRDILKFNPSA